MRTARASNSVRVDPDSGAATLLLSRREQPSITINHGGANYDRTAAPSSFASHQDDDEDGLLQALPEPAGGEEGSGGAYPAGYHGEEEGHYYGDGYEEEDAQYHDEGPQLAAAEELFGADSWMMHGRQDAARSSSGGTGFFQRAGTSSVAGHNHSALWPPHTSFSASFQQPPPPPPQHARWFSTSFADAGSGWFSSRAGMVPFQEPEQEAELFRIGTSGGKVLNASQLRACVSAKRGANVRLRLG